MSAPARFLFNVDFAAPPPPVTPVEPPEPTITISEHRRLLAAAEAAARDKGIAEGRQSAEARAAGRVADEASRLASAAQSMLAILDGERTRIEGEALRLAASVARKLAGRLIDLHPRERIEALFEEALGPLRKAPHVVVRLSAADAGDIGRELGKLAAERGFEGRLVVLPEEAVASGDCRIEWADGGIIVDRAVLERELDRLVDSHIGSLSAATADTPDEGEPS